jgi:hypothetical protein
MFQKGKAMHKRYPSGGRGRRETDVEESKVRGGY